MPTDGQTAMMKAVDFFAVCANAPKDAVTSIVILIGNMPAGCALFPILYHYQVLDTHLLTSQMSTNRDCPVPFVLRFVMWHM
jgi:hypothetical protein